MTTIKSKSVFSIDQKIIGQIERVAMSKGISKSEVVEKYLTHSLAHEAELTSIERYIFFRTVIESKLNNILLLQKIVSNGDIIEKIEAAFISMTMKTHTHAVTQNKNLMELGIFEVFEDIKSWDSELFDKCSKIMSRFGRTRKRYLALYPENR